MLLSSPKEKLLVTHDFSFSDNVFKRLVLQTLKNQGLLGKGILHLNLEDGVNLVSNCLLTVTDRSIDKLLKLFLDKNKFTPACDVIHRTGSSIHGFTGIRSPRIHRISQGSPTTKSKIELTGYIASYVTWNQRGTSLCVDNGYVRKQPVAWKEYCPEYWLKEI